MYVCVLCDCICVRMCVLCACVCVYASVCVACVGIDVYVEARVPTTAANGCLGLYTVQNDEYTFTCSSGLLSGCYFSKHSFQYFNEHKQLCLLVSDRLTHMKHELHTMQIIHIRIAVASNYTQTPHHLHTHMHT